VTSLNAIWSLFWHRYRPQTDIFWNIKCFLLGEFGKIFQSTSGPARGRIVRTDISINILKFLLVCFVFRSNTVLFLFQHYITALIFLYSLLSVFSLCVQIYILRFIKRKNLHLMQWRTVAISSGWHELALMNNSVRRWVNIFRLWCVNWWCNSLTFLFCNPPVPILPAVSNVRYSYPKTIPTTKYTNVPQNKSRGASTQFWYTDLFREIKECFTV